VQGLKEELGVMSLSLKEIAQFQRQNAEEVKLLKAISKNDEHIAQSTSVCNDMESD